MALIRREFDCRSRDSGYRFGGLIYKSKMDGIKAMEILRNRSWFGCKRAIQRRLRKVGIEVRKLPTVAFHPVSVFNLAVCLLMEKQGTGLRFVQVGANDGVFGDPLRRFILTYPWRGILVEPQPEVFAQLAENYKSCTERLILENLAISTDSGEIVLYKAPAGLASDEVYASSVASSSPRTVTKQLGIAERNLQKIVIPSLTLDELIAKHGFEQIEILQIDVEGYDWQVLSTIDLDKTAPKIIQFESGHLSIADCDNAVQHLTKHDYEIYWGGYQGDALAIKKAVLY